MRSKLTRNKTEKINHRLKSLSIDIKAYFCNVLLKEAIFANTYLFNENDKMEISEMLIWKKSEKNQTNALR